MSAGGRKWPRSTAVMARRVEPPDSLDYFPTPPWATRALVEHVLLGNGWRTDQIAGASVWEPACGAGHMARPLAEYFRRVDASDVHDYSGDWPGQGRVQDFLIDWADPPHLRRQGPDFVITNPPFRLAEDFARRGMQVARQAVALLVRTAFLEGAGRFAGLFAPSRPLIVAPFVERVPMLKGRLDPKGSTATSYAWLVFPGRDHVRTDRHTRLVWIPPCRRDLEREGDYPDAAAGTSGDGWLFA